MKSTSNYDSLSPLDLAQKSVSLASSLSEVTELIQSVIELYSVQNQQIQAKQDNERSGYVMQEIMRLIAQLKIPTGEQRIFKGMTPSQLDAYKEELYQQLKERDHPRKHLSVA